MFSCIIVFPIVVCRFNPLRLETFYAEQCCDKILKFIDESDDQDKSKLDRQLDVDYKKMKMNQIEAAKEEAKKMFEAKQHQAAKTGAQGEQNLVRFHSFKCSEKCGGKKTHVCSCDRFENEAIMTAGKKLLKFYRMTKTRNMFMDMRSLKREGIQLKRVIREVAKDQSTKRVLDDSLNINMVSWTTHNNGWCGRRKDQSQDDSHAKPYAELIFHVNGDDGLLNMYKDICHPTGAPSEAEEFEYRKSAFETALRQLVKEVTGTATNRVYVDVKHMTDEDKEMPSLARFRFPRPCGGDQRGNSSSAPLSSQTPKNRDSSGGGEAEGAKLKETELTFNMNPLSENDGETKGETKGDENA